jgi:hypothetical protein
MHLLEISLRVCRPCTLLHVRHFPFSLHVRIIQLNFRTVYSNLGSHSVEWASTLLAFLACLVTIPIYVFYVKGPQIRAASKFAQTLAHERIEHKKHKSFDGRVVSVGEKAQAGHLEDGLANENATVGA